MDGWVRCLVSLRGSYENRMQAMCLGTNTFLSRITIELSLVLLWTRLHFLSAEHGSGGIIRYY